MTAPSMKLDMSIDTPLVRCAEPREYDEIVKLMQTTWPDETDTHYLADPWFGWDQFRVADLNGSLVDGQFH